MMGKNQFFWLLGIYVPSSLSTKELHDLLRYVLNNFQQALAGEGKEHATKLPRQRVGRRQVEPERDHLLVPQSESGLPQNCIEHSSVYDKVVFALAFLEFKIQGLMNLIQETIPKAGCENKFQAMCSVDLSLPIILRSRVLIPSTSSILLPFIA